MGRPIGARTVGHKLLLGPRAGPKAGPRAGPRASPKTMADHCQPLEFLVLLYGGSARSFWTPTCEAMQAMGGHVKSRDVT